MVFRSPLDDLRLRSQTTLFRSLTAVARNERRAVERKIPLPLSVGAKPDQERNGINGGDPELVEGEWAVYAGFDRDQPPLRRPPRGRVIAVPAGGHIL